MEFKYESGRIYTQDMGGKLLAEITFPSVSGNVINIDHTFVDETLRGQGVADKLMKALVETMQAQGLAAIATCPYAKSWFANHPEHFDLLSVHE